MKVSELYIDKYHQFEEFGLNFTYPEGHLKEGEPLDKVCFIGQSGTGKTTLLEILKEFMIPIMNALSNYDNAGVIDDFGSVSITISDGIETVPITFGDYDKEEFLYGFCEIDRIWDDIFDDHFPEFRLFNYPSEIKFPNKKIRSEGKLKSTIFSEQRNTGKLTEEKVIDFENYDINQIWQTINEAVINDRETEIRKSLEISKLLRDSKVSKEVISKATDDFRKWREETPNPIQDLADNYLDKVIGRFNLKVKTELDFEKKEDIETIKIQQKNGKEIPFEALSTGTKQVILTALPLYGLKPKDSIILFDEPERSLYPDIQTEIVDFYTSMAENSQFFFATHSPLVAASFEPWEIIELKFNEETGNVEQELYYDEIKGRHVDNYTIYPQYLTYDGILKRVFDMKKESNSLRMSELVKLATLESQLKHNDLSPEAKKEKFEEIIKLADQLDWDLK